MIVVMLPGSGRTHYATGEYADETACGILRAETGLGIFDVVTDPTVLATCRVCAENQECGT